MTDGAASRWKTRAAALAVAAGTLALMVATEPKLAIGWDEGYTLGREARVRLWLKALVAPSGFAASWVPPSQRTELVADTLPPPSAARIDTRAKLLTSPDVLAWFWPFAREEPHGHPPFYAIVGMLGDVLAPRWADLPRARLGPMIAFSLASGAIFAAVRSRWGNWPAALASGAWALQPQMFALGHYATYDAILASLWVGAILAFARAARADGPFRWGSALLFGVLCGWAADTKLTGWFLPLPFVTWAVLARSRRGLWILGLGGVVGLVTLYAFNPPWWGDPIGGVIRFFRSNLSRAQMVPIPVLFLGRVVRSPIQSMPWYNTLVWTAIATPVGFLAMAMAGSVKAVKRLGTSDPLPILALGHWIFLLILRALPHTPGHDGVRQFLPAFGCLALVAGVGAAWAVERLKVWGKVLIAAALIEGAASVAVMMPVPLSYFSPIVGGLPGAARLGMEPTYFWDGLTEEALGKIRRSAVRFATYPTSWLYLQKEGQLDRALWPFSDFFMSLERKAPALYIVQNRPGAFRPVDRILASRYGADRRYILSEKMGVPLVWAFPYSLYEAESARLGLAP